MSLTHTECLADQEKLGGAIFQMVQQFPRVNRAVAVFLIISWEFPQKVLAAFIVDRSPIVGVDQIETPYLIALIDIGYAGRGQLQEGFREPVEHRDPRNATVKVGELSGKPIFFAVEHERANELGGGRLIGEIGIGPTGAVFGLAHGLDHVLLDALREFLPPGLIQGFERPGSDQRLVEKAFVVARRRGRAIDQAPAVAVPLPPVTQGQPP